VSTWRTGWDGGDVGLDMGFGGTDISPRQGSCFAASHISLIAIRGEIKYVVD
jgi:hypothetical protein